MTIACLRMQYNASHYNGATIELCRATRHALVEGNSVNLLSPQSNLLEYYNLGL